MPFALQPARRGTDNSREREPCFELRRQAVHKRPHEMKEEKNIFFKCSGKSLKKLGRRERNSQ